MSKVKQIVGAITLLVSFLLMAVPAFGQTRENTKERKKKGTSVASATKASTPTPSSTNNSNSATTATSALAASTLPLISIHRKNRSASGIAVSRLPVSGNAAVRQAPPVALDTNRISAGISGQTSLSAPTAPTSTNSTSTTTLTTTTTAKGLSAPQAPKPIN